jgi:cytochrome P450
MTTAAAATIPAHVPRELVRTFPFTLGQLTSENPFRRMVHDVHRVDPPVFYVPNVYPGGGPGWVVRRYADLRNIYSDAEHYSVKGFAPFAMMIGETWGNVPAEADAPLHDQYRALLNPLFTPAALKKLEAKVTSIAQGLMEKFRNAPRVEFRSAFAVPFPVSIILDLLGLPQSRMDEFMQWEHALLHDGNMENLMQATRNVTGMFRQLMKERRGKAGDDLVSFALNAKLGDRGLTDDEIVGFCFNLFIGGLDTVTTNLCWQFRHLAENVDQQRALRNDPALIPDAIQEMLRAYSSASTFRTCIKETEIAGVTIKPGDKVLMCTTLGSNDPEVFDHPEEVRFSRKPTHLAFGSGIHHCLGHHLARRELTIALQTLLPALPEFRLDPKAEILTDLGGVIQPRSVPLVFERPH